MKAPLAMAIIVLALSANVVALPASIPQKTVDQINGSQHITSIEAVSEGEELWSERFMNSTLWTVSGTPDIRFQLRMNKSLDLEVAFPQKTVPQAVSIGRSLDLALDRNPVVTIQAKVSRGIGYGVRFFGVTPEESSLVAWREGSSLQHRPGAGYFETINANLAVEAYLATGLPPSPGARITRIVFYVEASAGTTGDFSMRITVLNAISLVTTRLNSMQTAGYYKGFIIHFERLSTNQSIFQIFLAIDISGTSNLGYSSYFAQGLNVGARSFQYRPKSVATYELVSLRPQRISESPPFLPNLNYSSSVMVVAHEGAITFFRLNSLTLRFWSGPSPAGGDVETDLVRFILLNYYLMFLFGLPVATAILVVRVFKPEK